MASTNKGRKLYVCATAKPNALSQAEYEALTWVLVGSVGSIGESGTTTNIVSYDTLDTEVTEKQKGISNAGDPEVEVARNPTDPGQIILRAQAQTGFYYAFKVLNNDKPSSDYTDSVFYNRGLVVGPTRPNGRVEDFDLEVFTLGLIQEEIVVDPQPQVVPTLITLPSIQGTQVRVGYTLTALMGTYNFDPTGYTIQWQHDASGNGTFANVSVGGTGASYIPVVGDIADFLRVGITPINGAGSGTTVYSLPVGPIVAA